jgi:hypothetical protein
MRKEQRHRRLPSRSNGATPSKFDTSLAARSLLVIVRQEREYVERAG